MSERSKEKRKMPKGGRKGGAVFPRVNLKDAIGYARKLVSKTHTAPQPRDIIYSGVVGAKSGHGDIKISALKQYGFLKGDNKIGYSADDLAKNIASAPPEDLLKLYRKAILKPTVFKGLFDTYHGDVVSKAKLKQRAADLRVHPDETQTCVENYVAGMILAELVQLDADQVTHMGSKDVIGNESEYTEQKPIVTEEIEIEEKMHILDNSQSNDSTDEHIDTGENL